MDADAYLRAIREEAGRLVAAGWAGMERPVPSCPGWDLAGLVGHVGLVHGRVATMVGQRALEELSFSALPQPPGPPARLAWLEGQAGRLVGALEEVGPSSPVWNWTASPQTAALWFRRMAHETAVHRVDADLAGGPPAPIEADLAVDCVEELLEVFLPEAAQSFGADGLGGSLRLCATDRPAEWLLEVRDAAVTVGRAHGQAGATLRGPASDLALFAWGRLPAEGLNVRGDRAVIDRWKALRW